MRAKVRLATALVLMLSAFAGPSRAGVITYGLESLGNDQWRYDYSVTNDSLVGGLSWFTVYFAADLYDQLCGGSFETPCGIAPTAAPGWDPIVIHADPLLPDLGFFDVSTAGPGIALGDTLGGFSVSFHWQGSGTPGSQPFDFIVPGDEALSIVESGFTTPQPVTSVPEPGSLPLLAIGLFGAAWLSRRRGGRHASAAAGPRGRFRAFTDGEG